MKHFGKFVALFLMAQMGVFASETFEISDASLDKIHSDEFVTLKKTFAESPPMFQNSSDLNIPKMIAFDDSQKKIVLTPGDVIKISEDLTFSDWGGKPSSDQVAEEDFVLPRDKVKKTEEDGEKASKTKNIQFSRTSTH